MQTAYDPCRAGRIIVSLEVLHDLLKLPRWMQLYMVEQSRRDLDTNTATLYLRGQFCPLIISGQLPNVMQPEYQADTDGRIRLVCIKGIDS